MAVGCAALRRTDPPLGLDAVTVRRLLLAYAGVEDRDAAIWMLSEETCRFVHGNTDFYEGAGDRAYWNAQHQWNLSFTEESWQRQADLMPRMVLAGEEWPLVVVPRIPDERIRVQQGVFTFHGALNADKSACPTEKLWNLPKVFPPADGLSSTAALVERIWWDQRQDQSTPRDVVRKVRLKAAWRRDVIRKLQTMNITPDALFPGLDGIGRAASLQVQHGHALRAGLTRLAIAEMYGGDNEPEA